MDFANDILFHSNHLKKLELSIFHARKTEINAFSTALCIVQNMLPKKAFRLGLLCIFSKLVFIMIYVLHFYGKKYFIVQPRGFMTSEEYSAEYKAHLLELGIVGQNFFVNIEKKPLPDLTFVTALSENHAKEGRQLIITISGKFPRKKLLVFDVGLSKRSRKWYEGACNVDLRRVNLAKYGVDGDLYEYRWKPIVIAAALKEFPAIFWMDTSTNFRDLPFNQMLEQLPLVPTEPNVFFLSRTSHSLYAATHPGMYKYLASENSKLMKRMGEANKIIWYRTKTTYETLKLWVLCALEKECMAPSGAYVHCKFRTKDEMYTLGNCHKYDQSALNLILNSCQPCNSFPDLAWKYVYTNRSQQSPESVQPMCF